MDLTTDLPGLTLKNPIIPASGCCGYGEVLWDHYDLSKLGAIVPKSTTIQPREGANLPRYYSTENYTLNGVGLRNPGIEVVQKEKLPALAKKKVPIIQSIAGERMEDYVKLAELLNDSPEVSAIELNVSCPNIENGGMLFGQDPKKLAEVVEKVKKASRYPIYVKLTPNVTDIVEMAKIAENEGADAIVLINTLLALDFDLETNKSLLGNGTGGFSGRSVRPIAQRMVYQVAQEVKVPIIGVGGVEDVDSALKMLVLGASAVEVGTANYHHPMVCSEIIDQLPKRLEALGVSSLKEWIGSFSL